MFKNVFLKSLFTLRWHLFGWAFAVMFIAFFTMVLYPSFSQDGIENLVDSIPKEFQGLVGEVSDFKTVPGYIGQQIFGPNLYIVSLIMAIMIFLAISASEESDGRLQSLLSYPVSRTKVFVQKMLAAGLVVTLISLGALLGMWIALLIINETPDYARVWESTIAFCLINVVYGLIAFSTAMFTGSKGWTILVASGYTVASLFITQLAPAVDILEVPNKFSLLNYYNNPQIMANGLEWSDILIVTAVGLALVVIGWIGFIRRDVRTN